MSSTADDLLNRIREAIKEGDPRLDDVQSRWRGHEFTVCVDGKWRLEGFILYFKFLIEIRAALDGTIPSGLPPQCLDPVQIARLFRLPADAFADLGTSVNDADSLRRIEDKLEKALKGQRVVAESEYVSIKQAAKVTELSASHIRRAVRSGELPASNAGSRWHPVWRIARKDLDGWMEKKKGGNSIPPKSELKELIERHLPGL